MNGNPKDTYVGGWNKAVEDLSEEIDKESNDKDIKTRDLIRNIAEKIRGFKIVSEEDSRCRLCSGDDPLICPHCKAELCPVEKNPDG